MDTMRDDDLWEDDNPVDGSMQDDRDRDLVDEPRHDGFGERIDDNGRTDAEAGGRETGARETGGKDDRNIVEKAKDAVEDWTGSGK
ncbi:MAG TPA: hypothetical protein VI322_04020 [Candidatus Saccharimonadia bacterium]